MIKQKLNRRLGNPNIFKELRNPICRLKASREYSVPIEQYFDNWSRVHSVYCHYNIQNNDVNAMVYHVIYDESGDYVLTASVDGLIKIFDKTFKLVKTIKGHKRDISILTLSSDNRYIVSADESGLVRVWEFPSGKPVAVLTEQLGHEITTMTYHVETIYDENKGEDVPWRGFLITSSGTAGLIIYEDRHIGNI